MRSGMDEFARRPADERLAYISEAAARRDLQPFIIEKDFWVCWTLRRLVQSQELAGQLTFKGGTSLSKAYQIIERFSEDIDLTIAHEAPFLSQVKPPMDADISGNERQRRTKSLKVAAQSYVREIAKPNLETAIAEALGTNQGWDVVLDPNDPDAQTLLFRYPKLVSYGAGFGRGDYGAGPSSEGEGYIKPSIKLEFGARGETEPWEVMPISPYLAAEFPDELPDATTEVPTLSVVRTFWEKATILHALYHGSNLRREMSRHYYDTVMLDEHGIAEAALAEPALLKRVVRNKSLMFADAKASYETARLGTLRLLPTDDLRGRLKEDYAAMAVMFMSPPPAFEDLMERLARLEEHLNAGDR
jgi:hypothetical protein